MGGLYRLVLTHRRVVILAAIAITAVCAVLALRVGINFKLEEYLPEGTDSTRALKKLEEVYSGGLPNLRVFAEDVTVSEALSIKERIKSVEGVTDVLWLDDVVDIARPIETYGAEAVEAWYKGGGALFVVTVDGTRSLEAVEGVRAAVEGARLSGEAVREAVMKRDLLREIGWIMAFAIPLVLLVLLLTTTSWFQPVLFLVTIGIAIIINLGTNVFLGEVSYVTQATSAILQLAVSIDYAVFLLGRFNERRALGEEISGAMLGAMKESSTTIAASAMTTVFGFLSLILMRFRIGPDMGIVLAKGVLISYLSVMLFLPPLAIVCEKPLTKLAHKRLIPTFQGFGRFAARACVPVAAVVALLIVPGYLMQRKNDFIYGSSSMHAPDSEVGQDEAYINGIFGRQLQFALLVPEGSPAREAALSDALREVEGMTGVVSYATEVGAVPPEMLPERQRELFQKDGYSRIILYAATDDESEEAFAVVREVRALAEAQYPGENYIVSQSAVNLDLKEVITADNPRVLAAAVISVGFVIFLAFRNALAALILLLTIEGAVWINMAIPYVTGGSLNYIGYQIISSVQLGATIDYGILLAQRYREVRAGLGRREAAAESVEKAAASILAPAAILVIVGTVLYAVSTNGIVSQLGGILASGTAISSFLVLMFLPALLMTFDRWIGRGRK